MGRIARASITCSEDGRLELERISRSHSEAERWVERARIILACLAHDHQAAVAHKCGTRPNTVNKWRGRFMKHGMAGGCAALWCSGQVWQGASGPAA